MLAELGVACFFSFFFVVARQLTLSRLIKTSVNKQILRRGFVPHYCDVSLYPPNPLAGRLAWLLRCGYGSSFTYDGFSGTCLFDALIAALAGLPLLSRQEVFNVRPLQSPCPPPDAITQPYWARLPQVTQPAQRPLPGGNKPTTTLTPSY